MHDGGGVGRRHLRQCVFRIRIRVEILAITLCPYINFALSLLFVHRSRKLILHKSFILYLIYPPTPLPPYPPANHTLGKLKSRDKFQHSVGISALFVSRSVQERILKVSVLRN